MAVTLAQAGIANVPIGLHPDRVRAGSDFDRVWTHDDGDGNPRDFTGATVASAVIADPFGTQLVDFASGVTLGGTAGTIAVILTDTQTASAQGENFYSITLDLGGGITRPIQEGRITIGRAEV